MLHTELKTLLTEQLSSIYPPSETAWIHRHLICTICNIDFEQTAVLSDLKLNAEQVAQYKQYVNRLSQCEPLQYVLGQTEFYDLQLTVKEGVLIPRPETEEIVHDIVSFIKDKPLQVLDIGTGSGCIPIAIAKNCKNTAVSAYDISEIALGIAKENAVQNGANITYHKVDILDWHNSAPSGNFDLIVSNPPYVTERERTLMHDNVLKFEPDTALFVPDANPLLFYDAIAEFAMERLNPNGKLYFEINEQFGSEMKLMLHAKGFSDVSIHQDMQGKDRWTVCSIPGE